VKAEAKAVAGDSKIISKKKGKNNHGSVNILV
jgi:hypothetical protein